MSVNQPVTQETTQVFAVNGTGGEGSKTFVIPHEGHTIGNALRHVLMASESVDFAGYSVPHPSEPVVQIRVQARKDKDGEPLLTAVQAMKSAANVLIESCDFLTEEVKRVCEENPPESSE
jgi:DNA-directed RNA polymerase I and III subunit RPAC2